MKERKPVSRIDSNNTHGWFARVYRADWVGSKSFADRQYGGRDEAEAAAWKWWKMADERLPKIPPKPVLRHATVHLRRDNRPDRTHWFYYDVYLGTGRKTGQQVQFWFQNVTDPKIFKRLDDEDVYRQIDIAGVETIDLIFNSQEESRTKAYDLRDKTNVELQAEHREALVKWFVEHDRLMEEILRMWPEVKEA